IIPSWACKRFKRFHSDINNMYWSAVASSIAAFGVTRGHTVEESMPIAFGFPPEDVGYREISLGEWRKNFLDFQNWTRLNALMALSSYFENYLQSIGNLALESNPGILFNAHQVLDGATILKMKKHYIFINETIPLVKGNWPARVSAFKDLFGSCPTSLDNNIGELERIRQIRNGLGHAFGRTVSTKSLFNVADYSGGYACLDSKMLFISDELILVHAAISQARVAQ
ncbi:MAG: hypothetical protein K8R91_01760, partial [Phycisphaerae bacterium]|nr:hypothetical protein [Phycisphaerae bacterium]